MACFYRPMRMLTPERCNIVSFLSSREPLPAGTRLILNHGCVLGVLSVFCVADRVIKKIRRETVYISHSLISRPKPVARSGPLSFVVLSSALCKQISTPFCLLLTEPPLLSDAVFFSSKYALTQSTVLHSPIWPKIKDPCNLTSRRCLCYNPSIDCSFTPPLASNELKTHQASWCSYLS